jgi:DNA-binding response OmpR family regulator
MLIVDDEEKIRDVIREYAEVGGFDVTEAGDGSEAVELVQEHEEDAFHIIIMDMMMPKVDGFSAIRQIKKDHDIPVIMLSARGEEYDKLFAFELGVDDYIVKPFSPKELMARVNAVMSRRYPPPEPEDDPNLMRVAGIEVDLLAHTVRVDGEAVLYTPKEYELLVYMIEHRNLALAREQIFKDVWGFESGGGDDRTIDTHIKNIRLGLGPYRDKLLTLRGLGYKFDG